MIASICSNPKVLEVMRYINIFITIIRIVVPILLIFSLTFKLIKAVTSGNEDGLSKVKKNAPSNIIAAVVIFLIPSIVSLIVKVSFPNSDYNNCLTIKSVEEINVLYVQKEEQLVSKVEETLNINDYTNALVYLSNIKDENKIKEYENRLKTIKEKIDESNRVIDYSQFGWTYYEKDSSPLLDYYSDPMPLAVWGPNDVRDLYKKSIPLIIWLHGGVGANFYCHAEGINRHRIINVISNWGSTGLEPITAIIMAPVFCDPNGTNWGSKKSVETIKAIIKYAKNVYGVNKVVLMGHSDGGSGVIYVSRNNQDLFSKLVIMSGFASFNAAPSYYKKIPLKGYMTSNPARATDPNGGGDGNTGMERIFNEIGRSSDLIVFPKEVTHDEVQEKAFTTDSNNNNISDLIEWILE